MELEDDGELMLRYARGDLRAFEVLYQRHRGGLYRYLSRHTHNPEAANDLFQEVWSKVIASRDRYERRAKFQTFLYRIAHNCFVDYCRRSTVRAEVVSDDGQDDWHSALAAPDNDQPDAHAERAQATDRYRAALAQLPSEQRDVFLLYEESGLTLEENTACEFSQNATPLMNGFSATSSPRMWTKSSWPRIMPGAAVTIASGSVARCVTGTASSRSLDNVVELGEWVLGCA